MEDIRRKRSDQLQRYGNFKRKIGIIMEMTIENIGVAVLRRPKPGRPCNHIHTFLKTINPALSLVATLHYYLLQSKKEIMIT